MRFIYIDSQGKEVSIPTVDALALRIELGAITDGTRLFDVAAFRWAPAGEHEIYRALVREQEEKSGRFVAPPPPMVPPPTPTAPGTGADGGLGLDFDLTVAAPPEEPAGEPPTVPLGRTSAVDFSGLGGLLTDEADEEDAAAGSPADEVGADPGLAMESVLSPSLGETPSDPGPPVLGGLHLEPPLSDLPVDQAGWTARDRMKIETAEEEVAATPWGEERVRSLDLGPARPERPTPPFRPTPLPAAQRPSALPALILAAVAVAVLAGGGWLGWSRLRERQAEAAAAARPLDPPVTIPVIAPALEPRMRALADSARSDWLADVRTTLPAERGLPVEPDREWLGGSYLADASRYPGVEQYWRSVGALLDEIEASDVDRFAALYRERLDSAGVTAADAQQMLDRARAGFQAARPDRRLVYRRMRGVVDASLGLHEFLLANEGRIQHDPAAGGASRDPVLEAVPDTPELGNEMWGRVDRITASLDALGALDQVTTDRLMELLTLKLQAVPIR